MKQKTLLLCVLSLALTGCSIFNRNTKSSSENNSNHSGTTSSQITSQSSGQGSSGSTTSSSETPQPVKEARMQDTPILHVWNWSMNNISNNLQNIKDAGFKTIQISPMQQQKDYYGGDSVSYGWWKLYQPLGFSVATKDNCIGTKSELTSMCAKARSMGIDVIVDIVSNHLAGGSKSSLNSGVKNLEPDIYNNNLIHSIGKDANDNDLQSIVQGTIGDMPDLQTEKSTVQNRVLSLLKEYIDCGVNGFRFDAAKHIETPDDGTYASNYWPTILNGATKYATDKGLDEPYYYGEILYTCGKGRSFSSYTKYMSTIDSSQGSDVFLAVKNKNTSKLSATYNSGVNPNKLVLWGESHDTYANTNGETKDASQDVINKAYVIQTSRKDASTLYLARPNSMSDQLGNVGSTSYKNAEIKAINNFHNEFVGKDENITINNNCFVNVRGGQGAAIVNISNSSSSVKVSASGLTNGTYTDLVSNKKYTISNGEVTVSFTNDVCVLVNDNKSSETAPSLSLSAPSEAFSSTMDVAVTTSNATSISYTINGGTSTTLTGNKITIPSSVANGLVTLKVIASNQYGSNVKELKLVKSQTLYNKSLIIHSVDTTNKLYCWAWKDGGEGYWYEPTYEGSIAGYNLNDANNFIIVQFSKETNNPDWSNKISQTADISLTHQVYSYHELGAFE